MIDWLFQNRKLKNIRRCGVLRVNSEESVAEHSYFVTVIAFELARTLQKSGVLKNIDRSILAQKCLFHDIEESIMGDIPHPVKRASPEIYRILEEEKDKIVLEFFPNWVLEFNRSAKKSLEGGIVHMADFLELYMYCTEERMSGNRDRYWLEILETCKQVLAKSDFPEVAAHYLKEIDAYFYSTNASNENTRITYMRSEYDR